MDTVIKPVLWIRDMGRKYPSASLWLAFIIASCVAGYIFYLRFPNNLIYPNFYAEDGQIFTQNILNKGFIGALLTTFNGYYIFGIYLLAGVGFVVNSVLFGGELINLPGAFAITSYLFLGICAALPVLALRQYLTLPYRLGLALLLACVPMPEFDYGTLGTIGNLKFIFVFIAVLAIMYRATLRRSSRRIIAVDACLAFCAYTSVSTYPLLLFLLVCDGLKPQQLLKQPKKLLDRSNLSLWSAVALAGVLVIQLVVIVLQGIPRYPGYLDEPYQAQKTIEVFIARPYLYPLVSWGYRHLNDLIVVALFVAILFAVWRWGRRSLRPIYALFIFAIFEITAVFVSNRTGVTAHYNHYQGSSLDNFFYTQNFIFLLLVVFLIADIARRMPQRVGAFRTFFLPAIAIGLIFAGEFRTDTSYAKNDFMQYAVGPIKSLVRAQCDDPAHKKITWPVYPFTFLTMTEPRKQICTHSVYTDTPTIQSFGLKLSGSILDLNTPVGTAAFTQTFVPNSNNLNGLAVYLSTYYQTRLHGYNLVVKDAGCSKVIRSVQIPVKVRDNTFDTIFFEPIAQSKDTQFCFSIEPETSAPQKLAVQLSVPHVYETGHLTISGANDDRDIVFQAVYKGQ